MSPDTRPHVTVVVSVYRRADFLAPVLDALVRQNDGALEVVVAEDGQGEEIAGVVGRFREQLGARLLHVTQPHDGFGKTRIMNAALRASRNPFVVFLDGDCVAHPGLVATYRRVAAPGRAFFGRRVMLGPAFTASLLAGAVASPPSLLALLRSDSKRVEEALRIPFFRKPVQPTGIWGCNWGVLRAHLEAVNGFDEDYVTAGVGEDVDVEWRLQAVGVTLESVKHRAIVYHLHHPANYGGDDVARGRELLALKKASNRFRCAHGLARST